MSNLFSNVASLCKMQGISVWKLEKDLGFSTSAIQNWKRSSPRVDKLKAVADYFNVSVDRLICGAERFPLKGTVQVIKNGEAICCSPFDGIWKMVDLVTVFGKDRTIEVRVLERGDGDGADS